MPADLTPLELIAGTLSIVGVQNESSGNPIRDKLEIACLMGQLSQMGCIPAERLGDITEWLVAAKDQDICNLFEIARQVRPDVEATMESMP